MIRAPHQRCLDLARLVLTLAAASIAFLFNVMVTRTTPISREYLLNVAPRVALYLCATVLFLMLFMILLTLFYEKYSHFHACGYTGSRVRLHRLFLFLVAYLRLVLSLV
jgi:hypothetical protein